jgi:hypothetical protein
VARDMKSPGHVTERRLIQFCDAAGKPLEKRKRGVIVDGLLGYTDEGFMCVIATGRAFGPPHGADGKPRPDVDPEDLIMWMLDQDPDGWEKTRRLTFGEHLTSGLKERLSATLRSYPADRKFTPEAG